MPFHPQSVFEVHFSVKDRSLSTDFYQRVLGCKLATHIDRRDITFLWMQKPGSIMIGLWGPHCPDPPMARGKSHVAFRLSPQEVEKAPNQLLDLGVQPLDFDEHPTDEAIVLCWMPAISIYLHDPDGHSLEFISMLDEAPRPDMGVMKISEWRMHGRQGEN
jgi:lactoylglutathione lyase